MKKFLLSATLLVAFSLTSFAAEKTTNDSVESKANTAKEKTEVATKEKTADCTIIHLRWNEGVSDGADGMKIIYHRVDIEVCDDGSVTITGK
ncbi:hypothetical protein [Flavobacterium sp. XS2P14]|uniref:hypothetical protein n=1 Tax=Flavobacterium sp. XS2P14 TaxID=3401735 RepID=UPI003AB016E3